MQSGVRETERDETGHGRVVYLCLCSPRFGCRLDRRLACHLPFTLDPGPPDPRKHLAETETGFYLTPNLSRSGD